MLEISSNWLFQILRIGFVLSAAVLITIVLLRLTKASPTTRVLAWVMVLLPGWILFSVSLEIPWYESKVSQSPEPVFSISSYPNLDTELNVLPTNLVHADPVSQSEDTGNLFFLTLISVWLTGMIVIAGRNVYSFLKLSAAVNALPQPANSAWLDEFDIVYEASELQRKPCFKVSNSIGPLVCRSNRNFTVVVPNAFWNECSSEQRIAVLQHELAHIERGDVWTLLIGRVFALPQWFNPLVWFALRRLDEAIEMACDDHVLCASPEKQIVYARSLLALVEFNHSEAAFVLSAAGPPVSHRIQRILNPQGNEMKFTRMFTLFTLVSFSIIALFRLELVAQEPQVQNASRSVDLPLIESPEAADGEFALPNAPVPGGLEQVDGNEENTAYSYYVGDLVVSITPEKMVALFETGVMPITKKDRGEITQQDFLPLIDLIKNTISPESWGEGATVQPFVPNLSLIVSQDRRGHDELQELLLKLRELNDVVLRLESHVVVVDKTTDLNAGGSDGAISAKDFERKISEATDEALATSTRPVTVSFNGQDIAVDRQDIGDCQIDPVNLMLMVTADRQAVKVLCSHGSTRAPDAGSGPKAEEAVGDRRDPIGILEVASKGYATFDITPALVSGNDDGNQRAILIVRPTISVRESD